MRSVSGQRTAEPYLSNGRVSDDREAQLRRGYVAVTIANDQQTAVASTDGQQGTAAPPARSGRTKSADWLSAPWPA